VGMRLLCARSTTARRVRVRCSKEESRLG
jgi:hypothetical protein